MPVGFRRWALVLFVSLAPLVGPYGQSNGYSPELHMGAFIQVGALVLLALLVRQGAIRLDGRITLPLAVFYGWAVVSLLWAHNRYEGTVTLMHWGAALVVFLVVVDTLRTGEATRQLLFGIFVSGLLVAMLGIAQYVFDVGWVQQSRAPAATFGNKNLAAQYILLTWPIGAAFFLRSDSRRRGWLLVTACSLMTVFVVYAASRAAWLSFALQLALFTGLLAYRRTRNNDRPLAAAHKKWMLVGAAGLVLLMVNLPSPGLRWGVERFVRSGAAVFQDARLEGGNVRVPLWLNSSRMIRDHPLIGVGVGNWAVEYPLYQQAALVDFQMSDEIQHAHAHNDYLELTAELGTVGLALLLWLLWRVMRVVRSPAADRAGPDDHLITGVVVALVGIGFDSLFSFPFKQPVPALLVLVYLGVLVSGRRQGPAVGAPRGWIRAAAVSVVLILTMAVLLVHVRWYRSEVHFRAATFALLHEDHDATLAEAQRAYRLNPHRARLLNLVAMGYYKTGRTSDAIDAWERVAGGYPNLSHTMDNLARAYADVGEFEKAEERLRHVLAMRPHSDKAHRNLGVLLLTHLGRTREGVAHLERALEIDPDTPDAHRIRRAIESAQSTLGIGPTPAR